MGIVDKLVSALQAGNRIQAQGNRIFIKYKGVPDSRYWEKIVIHRTQLTKMGFRSTGEIVNRARELAGEINNDTTLPAQAINTQLTGTRKDPVVDKPGTASFMTGNSMSSLAVLGGLAYLLWRR